MSELIDFYQKQAKSVKNSPAWFATLQENALNQFIALGFPLRKSEEWKYTALDHFFDQRFTFSKPSFDKYCKDFKPHFAPTVTISNGELFISEELKANLPSGVIIQPLLQSLEEQEDKLKPHLGKLLKISDGFQALNLAALNTGLVIYIPKSVIIDKPLVLAHWQDAAHHAVHSRLIIIAEEGSQASIIQSFQGEEGLSYLSNSVSEIYLAPKAKLSHYNLLCDSKNAYHIEHTAVAQQEESYFASHLFNLGGLLSRADLSIELREPGASCLMNGMYFPKNKQHMDQHTLVSHLVPDCKSMQNYKGVLSGNARAVFSGKIKVAKDAIHTEASQQNKNLLLSEKAEINTKPQLEIFADDVRCSHGATVGQLDEDALFYLATRGLSAEAAKHYLILAFAADNLTYISEPEVTSWMLESISQLLDKK